MSTVPSVIFRVQNFGLRTDCLIFPIGGRLITKFGVILLISNRAIFAKWYKFRLFLIGRGGPSPIRAGSVNRFPTPLVGF